jgi:hypothetical protein
VDALATVDATLAIYEVVESIDGKTSQQALQIMSAVLAGKVSGAGGNAETFLGLDGSTSRIVVNADSSGNRTAVTYE